MMDVAIAAALLLFAALGWRRGLVRTLSELAAVALALLLATQISRAAAPVLVDRALRPAAHAAIERRVEELSAETESASREGLQRVLEGIPNAFLREKAADALEGMLASGQLLGGWALEPLSALCEELADAALDTVVRDMVQSVLCAACFLLLACLLRLAARALRVVERLPVARQCNELGGAALGLGKGLLLVCLAVWVLRLTGVVTAEMAEGSAALGLLARWTGGLLG